MAKSFIGINNLPAGYQTPSFPSLYWPINNESYSTAYLYYSVDIWKFTVYWTLIFFGSFYGAAGMYAMINHRTPLKGIPIVLVYCVIGLLQGMISGSVVGLILGAIYKAGTFSMSCWIPLVWGVIQILYVVGTSYSLMIAIL